MKTHSGSWWLDVSDCLWLFVLAMATFCFLVMAWHCADQGDLRSFLSWGCWAILAGFLFARAMDGQLTHAERIAVGNYKIEQLRKEIAQIRASTETLKAMARERAG